MIWFVWSLVILLCCFIAFLVLSRTSSEPDPYEIDVPDRMAELRARIDLTV
jgi:hypothetical protein